MTAAVDGTTLRWVIVVAVAVGLFAIRLSFMQLFEWADNIPTEVDRLLRLVPPAVLAALVVPDLTFLEGQLVLTPGNDRLIAGVIAVAVAWYTEDILRTLVVGMGALWALTFLL